MKRTLAFLLLAAGPLPAQAPPPQAQPVDPSLQADPGNDMFQRAKNLFDQANASKDASLLQRAAEIFNEYLGKFPNHANAEAAWLYLGQSLYQSGKVDDGKRCFHTLINRYREGPWVSAAAYTLAYDHYSKGDYALAAPLFQKYADNSARPEDHARGYFFAATCYRLQNKDREAADLYRKVIGDPSGNLFAAQAKVALGNLLAKSGKHADALKLFEEVATSTAPAKVRGEAALNAALSATKLDQHDLADKYLKLVSLTPGMEDFRPDAVTALMANSFDREDYRGVIDAWRKSGLQISDDSDPATTPDTNRVTASDEKRATRLMLAARASLKLKQPAEALGMFRRIEQTVPPQHDLAFQASFYRLLCFYEIEGQHVPDQVDAFLQIYRKGRPNDTRIHTALMMKAESLFAKKDLQKAAQAYSEVDVSLISEANRAGLLYQRGWCLAEAGDPQGAIRSLGKFITDYPKDSRVPTALAKRAKAYADSGEGPKAIEDFDQLIKQGGDPDLVSFAWLESARMRRTEGNIPDMIVRYKGLLSKSKDPAKALQAEANYFIGWGLVKTNAPKEAVPFLEQARKLDPGSYKKHVGVLLALGYFASQDPAKLADEIDLAIKENYTSDIPEQALRWAGMQSYNSSHYAAAARFLERVANFDEPRETSKEVWRYLGKALLETGKPDEALKAVENVLAVEDNPAWKADGLLDKGLALFALKKDAESRKCVKEAIDIRPEGRVRAGLQILSGDLYLRASDPAKAAEDFLYPAKFIDDRDLKPLALWKLAQALEKSGNASEAARYREQLKNEFPGWQPPAEDTPPAPAPPR